MSDRCWLLLETSGRVGLVGLGLGATLIAERRLDEGRRHAQDLIPAAAELLRAANWQSREVAGVAVSLGPGSYTGLRVGVMTAKAFAYATGCPLAGVPTFEVIAAQADVPCLLLDVIAGALKDKLYVQRFRRNGSARSWSAESPLAIRSRRDWIDGLPPDVAVTGPGLQLVDRELPAPVVRVESDRRGPGLAALLMLAESRTSSADRAEVMTLEPIYLRPSSAEEQWKP